MSMTIGPVGAPGCSRRQFVIAAAAAAAAPGALAGWFDRDPFAGESRIVPRGPGAKYVPRIFAAAVRRKGEYGLRWPGAVYDGVAALKDCSPASIWNSPAGAAASSASVSSSNRSAATSRW